MTALVDARALWWTEPTKDCTDCEPGVVNDFPCACVGGWASPINHGTVDGWMYLTDRFVLLPAAVLGGLPVGYDKVLGLEPIRPQAMDAFAEWLNTPVILEPSDRAFARGLIDPLEQAGYRLRPLEGVKDAHGVCDEDLKVIGLAIPVRRNLVFDDSTYSRVVAA